MNISIKNFSLFFSILFLSSCSGQINKENFKERVSPTRENINKINTPISLKDWEGVYLNSDNENLHTIQSIKDKVGWFKIKISFEEISFSADTRMRDDYPQSDPGGVYIDNACNYYLSNDNDTIEIYRKKYDDPIGIPINKRGSEKDLLATLYKKNNTYYAISKIIEESENYNNSARSKSNSPLVFYKFPLDEDKD